MNEKEARDARAVYSHAVVVSSGNPLWENFGKSAMTRDKILERIGKVYGVLDKDTAVILIPWTKDPILNCCFASFVINAAALIPASSEKTPFLLFTQHPGDTTPHEWYNESILTA